MENYELEKGRTKSGSFAKYILPTSLDVPKLHQKLLRIQILSPLGAKEIMTCNGSNSPAIMNTIYDTIGIRIKSLPATPEKILNAL